MRDSYSQSAFLAELFDLSPQAMALEGANGKVMLVNREFTRMFGHPPEAALGRRITELTGAGGGVELTNQKPHRIETETSLRRTDGTSFQARVVSEPVVFGTGERARIVAFSDLSGLKRLQTLREGENGVLEMIAQRAPLDKVLSAIARLIESQTEGMLSTILLLDKDGVHVRHGAAPSLPESFTHAIDGAEIGPQHGSCGTAAYRNKPVVVTDILTDPLWADWRGLAVQHNLRACWSTPIRASNGKILGTFAMYYREVRSPQAFELELIRVAIHLAGIAIEAKQSEEALQGSQDLLQRIMDTSQTLIFVKDIEGRYLLVNNGFLEFFHLDRNSVLGRTDRDLFSGTKADTFQQSDRDALAAGSSIEVEEVVHVDKEGEHTFLSVKNPIRDTQGKIYAVCGIATDITERKRLEAQLREAQKMEAIGKLAGGIAHDFNNLMTIVTGYSDILRQALAADPALNEKVDEIQKAGEQATALTRQLLAFSRRQTPQPRLLNINDVVSRLASMLRRLLRDDIELAISPDPAIPLIRADTGQIEQVILNLVINARDAMPDGGQISISTSTITKQNQPHGEITCVRLSVQDTGLGMNPEIKAHIFEPFFTTKEQGKGTGLGLATVHGIVQQARGNITVESEMGNGTSFEIDFPSAEGAATSESATGTEPAKASVHGNETILVVEDQDGLRALISEILRKNGYQVWTASNGIEALRVLDELRGRNVDLVITDVVMPHMGGRALVETLSQTHPATKVIYMSGYVENLNELLKPGHTLLDKPFAPSALLHRVREVLDAHIDVRRAA